MGEEAGGCSGSLHGLGPVLPPCLPLLGGASSEGPSILHPPRPVVLEGALLWPSPSWRWGPYCPRAGQRFCCEARLSMCQRRWPSCTLIGQLRRGVHLPVTEEGK